MNTTDGPITITSSFTKLFGKAYEASGDIRKCMASPLYTYDKDGMPIKTANDGNLRLQTYPYHPILPHQEFRYQIGRNQGRGRNFKTSSLCPM